MRNRHRLDNQEKDRYAIPTLEKSPPQKYYPVSLQQEGVWLQTKIAPERTLWNSSYSWRIEGRLNLNVIRNSIQNLIQRHASLRTNFSLQGDQISQTIHEKFTFDDYLKYTDISTVSRQKQEQKAKELEKETAQTPYDLEKSPLARFSIIRFNETDHLIVIGLHHIISDMTSRQMLWKELVILYNAETSNQNPDLEPLDIQYYDYAQWQQKFLKSPYYQAQKESVIEELTLGGKGKLPVLDLPFDFPHHENSNNQSGTSDCSIELSPHQVKQLRTFSLRRRQPFSALFLAAFYILLHKHSGQDDIVLGTMNRGRKTDKKILKKIMGLFANHIAMRLKTGEETTLEALLTDTAQKIIKAYHNQEFLYEDLLRTLQPERSPLHAPIFQVVFNMIKVPGIDTVPEGHTAKKWEMVKPIDEISYQYHLSLYVRDEIKKVTLRMLYTRDRFNEETIKRYLKQYINILKALQQETEKKLVNLSVITEEEQQQILYKFNNTDAQYPDHQTIEQLFTRQVEQTPNSIALLGHPLKNLKQNQEISKFDHPYMFQLSYKEFNNRTRQLSFILKNKGIKPETITAIMIERSLNMIIGIFAIMKAGGAYLPIDPSNPEERINYTLKDSSAKLLLKSSSHESFKLGTHQVPIVNFEQLNEEKKQEELKIPKPPIKPDHLLYIIYTSGSTGKPKGVMITHKSLVNRLNWMQKQYPLNPVDTLFQKTPTTFDVSVWEIFWWALTGAKLCLLPPGEEKIPLQLIKYINRYRITIAHFVPSMLNAFLHYLIKTGNTSATPATPMLPPLKRIICSGEALTPALVNLFKKTLHSGNRTEISNLYGPTEATVDVSFYNLPLNEEIYSVPIGKPIDNIRLLILDRSHRIQPLGVAGELVISGVGLARGYLNRPALTAEKFLATDGHGQTRFNFNQKFLRGDPGGAVFSKSAPPGRRRLYKTGDLARWQSDGNIEYLDRIDNQVKIRGIRIELGEIETAIARFKGIQQVVVTTVTEPPNEKAASSTKSLCAYILPKKKTSIDITGMRENLNKNLPGYLIPSYFIQLEKIPLTSSGKIHRNALPSPFENGIISREQTRYQAPQNHLEHLLVSVWQEVLGLNEIGVKDSFFLLGGDSIKAIQVAAKLHTQGYMLEISQLFKHPTIRDIAPLIKRVSINIDQSPITGTIPLHPIQKWYLQQNFKNKHHWNLAFMLNRPEGFDQDILKAVLRHLQEHHDMLRAVLSPTEDALIIKKIDEIQIPLEVFHITTPHPEHQEKQIKHQADRIQSGIDLYNGPLLKTALFKTPTGDHLLLVLHHLIVDGISWRILFEDIDALNRQIKTGQEILLPQKTHSYKYWIQELTAYSRTPKLLQEFDYWESICSDATNHFLPLSGQKKGKIKDYYRYSVELDESLSYALLNEVNRTYNTEINDLLLSALSRAIYDCYQCSNPLVALEGHGRESINPKTDISRTVGWHTALYPIKLETLYKDDLSMHIRFTKENLRKIPNNGTGYGILRYLAPLTKEQRQKLEVAPQIGFNYMGQFDTDMEKGGYKRSPYNSGETRSPESQQIYKININGIAINRKIRFTFNGDTQTLEKHQIETLAQTFRKRIEEIIHHCQSIEKTIKTPSDFDAIDLDFNELKTIYNYYPAEDISKIYNVSPMQEGMLFHYLLDPLHQAYLVQIQYRLEGEIDEKIFTKSCQQLQDQYEIFRTAIVHKKVKRPRQVVLKHRPTQVQIHRLNEKENKTTLLEDIKTQDRKKGFHLQSETLIRYTLIKTDPGQYLLLITYQHMILDGWSTNLLLKNLIAIYDHLKNEKPFMQENHPTYQEYIEWLNSQDMEAAADYWQENLKNFDRLSRIPPPERANTDENQEYKKREYTLTVPPEINRQLQQTAARLKVTQNIMLQTAWTILLQRYCGTHDIVFGNVISGRNIPLPGIEKIMGLFINTVPMRITLESGQSFSEIAHRLQEKLLKSQQFGFLALGEIQKYASIQGSLLEHLYIYENYPVEKEIRSRRLAEKVGFNITERTGSEQTNYYLNLLIIPREELLIHIQYYENIYPSPFISNLAGAILKILEQAVQNPEEKADNYEIITPSEKQQLLEEFNNTKAAYPKDKTVHHLFLEQVVKNPHRIALLGTPSHLSEQQLREHEKMNRNSIYSISYKELNQRTQQLASLLHRKGIGPDKVAAIMVKRSLETITGIFAIIKAGGAYMPIDPGYPEERINYMLTDSRTKILLHSNTNKPLKSIDRSINQISFEKTNLENLSEIPYIPTDLKPVNLAYIIYTSGSTGKPKGVLIEHQPLMNRLNWMQKKYPLDRHDTILHKTPFTFDVSVWEIFWWSMIGAKVCLLNPGGEKDPRIILRYIERYHITVMHFVPSMLNLFLDNLNQSPDRCKPLTGLKQVIASGEALTPAQVRLFNRLLSLRCTRLANLYGPTEATIDVTYYDCPTSDKIQSVPIGKPIDNINLYVLYKDKQIQPFDVAGELGIVGDGLARGYLNRPELTAEKFLAQDRHELPWLNFNQKFLQGGPGGAVFSKSAPPGRRRLYKTGDLAKWQPDGNIEYLERIDNQVKIRGNRIELGEIQAYLMQMNEIKEAVIAPITDKSGTKTLCAYLVTGTQQNFSPQQLKENLEQKLPDYMIPSYFVPLKQIPLTPNGKIDYKSFPLPEKNLLTEGEYIAPKNHLENQLQNIWQNLLNLERISVTQSFFQLGGNSLSAMKMAFEIHKQLGIEIPLWDIFDNPTISQIARLIQDREENIKKFDRILTEIENMTEEQVLKMLETLKDEEMEM